MNQYDEAEKVPHFHFVASQPDPTPQDVAAPTLEQLAKACLGDMRELVIHPNDQERDHCEADDILCKLLRAHGHDELVDLFEKLDKWYA